MTEPTTTSAQPLLEVTDLTVSYRLPRGSVQAVRSLSFNVMPGETVAIVGESGSGKSTTAHALVRMLPSAASVDHGSIRLDGEELSGMHESALRRVRGARIGFVPQDPTMSLNPLMKIGTQVGEVLRIHGTLSRDDVELRTIDALTAAGIDNPEFRARQYPHELSGGMRQRVLIAIAIIARPSFVIADEPTSALDVTVQQQILDHLDLLRAELHMAVILITHDLGVAADRADRILVMHNGVLVESGTPEQVLMSPQADYTRSLLAAAPGLSTDSVIARAHAAPARLSEHQAREAAEAETASTGAPLLRVSNLIRDFGRSHAGNSPHIAVNDVSFCVAAGQTHALVGESGSGKTTTARLALRLEDADAGQVLFRGEDITRASGRRLRELRRNLQLVHQNPYASLNPRLTVGQIIADPLRAFHAAGRVARKQRVAELLDLVALTSEMTDRSPFELSGGQRQRVAIARALAISPDLLVLDEPVSALDVRVQHQILELLVTLQQELGTTYLFITHDLAVVKQIAHTVAVMRRGEVLEQGAVSSVFNAPAHDYTAALLEAIPGRKLHA